MAINFPNSPNTNQSFTASGKTWHWDGASWKLQFGTSSSTYTLPIATGAILGGIKVGSGLSIDSNTGVLSTTGGSGGSSTFVGLTDTPSAFGTAGQYLKINAGGTALEWTTAGVSIDLTAFSVTTAAAGTSALSYDNTNGVFTFTPTDLSGCLMVSLNNPTTGQVIKYNGTTWVNSTDNVGTGGGGASTLFGLSDVIETGLQSNAGEVLRYNGGNWTNYDIGADIPSILSDLTDVATAVPSNGQVLKWDGSQNLWLPSSDLTSSGGSGIGLTDLSVTTVTASGGGALAYNNTTGLFTFTPAVAGGASVSVAETAPANPSSGDLWWKSDEGQLKVWYDDGSGSPSAQWVDTGGIGAGGTTGNDYVDAAALSGTDLVIGRTGALADITVDLSTLGGGGSGEMNVQSDWNETDASADSHILNKPTLFSGSYTDLTNKPTIPANISDLADVSNGPPSTGNVLTWNGSGWIPDAPSGGSGGSSTFVGLTDTPSSFTADQWLKVNSGGTDIELVSSPTDYNIADYTSFTNTGVRTLGDRLADIVHLEDFRADDGTSIVEGSSATNQQITKNTEVFKNAIASGKTVIVPSGLWYIDDTLIFNVSHTGMIGDESLGTTIQLVLANNNTNKPAIKLESTTTSSAEYITIKNLYIKRSVASNTASGSAPAPTFTEPQWPGSEPTAMHSGVALDGSNWQNQAGGVSRSRISNLRIGNFVTGMYFSQVVGCLIEKCLVQQLVLHSTASSPNTSATGYHVGYHFVGDVASTGAMSPLASIEVNECQNDLTGTRHHTNSNFQDIGFFLDGNDLRDIFLTNCETACGRYGFKLKSATADANWDVHIIRPIIDQFKHHGILVEDLNGTGAVNINGGYAVGAADADASIAGINSNGIVISNFQPLGLTNNTSEDDGIALQNCTSCSIIGNRLLNLRFGISLNDSSYNTIVGNVISAWIPTDGTANAAVDLEGAIRFYGTSSHNSIIGNSVRGVSNSNRYDDGILFNGGNVSNNIGYGNVIEADSVSSLVTHTNGASTTTNLIDPIGDTVASHITSITTTDIDNWNTAYNNYSTFPTGTQMIFKQASAPTGWTKVSDANVDNSALRVVTGSTGGSGSNTGGGFSTIFTSHTPTGTVSGSVSSHTLSTSEMPSHNHKAYNHCHALQSNGSTKYLGDSNGVGGTGSTNTGNRGSGYQHNHTLSGTSFTGDAIDLTVKYSDVIICSKD